ncbi:S-layer homology domain-containing protein [Paenibacillus sp. HJGM_3]|uniref:S-layer homology domain-containing protein n=1 Tax=Paenibacillus sp. HJGM_3 TaxID=3379816 RepID=UPI003859107A
MKKVFKQLTVTGLTLAMVVGGSTAAFADNNKGKGNDKDDRGRVEQKDNTWKNSWKDNEGVKFVNNGTVNIVVNFNDIQGADVEWAIKNITSLSFKKVFEGYEDGSFKPRNTISRVEAITAAVRLLGLEDQAKSQAEMSTKLNFKDADQIPSWAVGYVAVALENDLFGETENMVQPNKAADRLWATTLLVKALKLDAEAKAKMNTQLQFKDAKEIPAGSVGYVAVAVEKGLIDGFENNTFRPNTPVTRAQMAALVDRADSQMPDKDSIKGKVTTVVGTNISVQKADGSTQSITLDPNAFVFAGGARVPLSEITVGDEVVVKVFTVNNVTYAYFVDITKSGTPVQDLNVQGTLVSWANNNNYKLALLTVDVPSTVTGSTYERRTYAVADTYELKPTGAQLLQGQTLLLKGVGSIVNYIEVK